MDEDALVFVIDLRAAAMGEVESEIDAANAGAFVPRVLPDVPERAIDRVALVVDEGEPVVLDIEPTRDVRWLDALARLRCASRWCVARRSSRWRSATAASTSAR